ncbi:MAG: glycosyl hydrolase [Ignavibacteria bacterium]|nr:glycosyl hydrolase [Ignavibacteria bacterium]
MKQTICILLIVFIYHVSAQRLAKYEPSNGCYIGAFIQNDINVNGMISNFEQVVGKKHTGYLTYTSVSSPFPKAFADSCKKYGAFMQLGFEPDTAFRDVVDGPHLRNWAKEAARSGIPIFLRFASEMNGDWVPWFGSPTLYKEKWRLMYNIMKEEAPNVAMVWCPNWRPDIPNDTSRNIMAYYPGDEYVDWVGVNFYMWGPVYDSLMNERGISPLSKIGAVYNKFPNKPIMICEWAAASREWRGNPPLPKITTDYCVTHMQTVYNNLQTIFPRVKGVFWFNYNTYLINKSDFSLTNNQTVLNTYKNVIQNSYYITSINYNVPVITIPQKVVRGIDSIPIQVLCSRPITEAKFYVNGILLQTLNNEPFTFVVNFSQFDDGQYEVEVRAKTIDGYEGRGYQKIEIDNNRDFFEFIIDNTDTLFKGIGGWLSTSQPDRFGNDYYVLPPNSNAYGEWNFYPSFSGVVKIFAYWSAHPNRSTNALYSIWSENNLLATVGVNQRQNGGMWNLLGEFNVTQNQLFKVKLNASTDGYVIADAIRIYRNTTQVEENIFNIKDFKLMQNYPNPFNSSTRITFSVNKDGVVKLKVYDLLGREVKTLFEDFLLAGTVQSIDFNGMDLSSGIYFVRLIQNEKIQTIKMTFIK